MYLHVPPNRRMVLLFKVPLSFGDGNLGVRQEESYLHFSIVVFNCINHGYYCQKEACRASRLVAHMNFPFAIYGEGECLP